MIYATLKLVHLLAMIIWIGGMVFARFFLQPAIATLETPERVRLMHDILQRFFKVAFVAAALVLGTGLWMIGRVAKAVVQGGGSFSMPLSWTLMAGAGIVMVLIFSHIRFALFKRLRRAVQACDWTAGAEALTAIRTWVTVNLGLGVLIVAIALLMA